MKTKTTLIAGIAAPLAQANLDTDQIMPKQFLRGIDKQGLAAGLLYDLRFYPDGRARPDFILNLPEYKNATILVGGANFGCGSSREHAVWGMQQFGIQAVIASSFGEIFYSNAMNNGLLLVMLPDEAIEQLMDGAGTDPVRLTIDIEKLEVSNGRVSASFHLSERHHKMILNGLDMLGASLLYKTEIISFAEKWHEQRPWLKDVARKVREKLS
ncbi:putative 3-isopropylmalate dehydratase small subunit (Isopropylmalate isomerase) (Alpha-IPM isomerase) (IPMI) (LeuD) [Herminiimonas arsenicoxydans]|uniref:3-isopropylmalate dehydratase small subunit n=1 Tax=Herminiimonas arsenicoxydans TaxID=204773 RepID=A4G380_HERAR|nr:putative 3-isopropylmalate dehydratase small subunit (Isopropylmalate isomerase) (Alpha-IPM isomerase) (IPMI) (LeuD) [Herminiimonas arsenicoxydans]